MSKTAEKTRTNLESEGINKENKSEIFRISEHIFFYADSQMPGYNAHKKHESNTERNAFHLKIAKKQSYSGDE